MTSLAVCVLLSLFAVAQGACPCPNNESLTLAYGPDDCLCACVPYDPTRCRSCPEQLKGCAETCCFLDNVSCDSDGACRTVDTLDFVTAAKIAVLFALTVTCLAAMVAIIRAFFLPLCRSRSNDNAEFVQGDNRSLNSVQRFVLDRLTNRPPPYEHTPDKPPTYEECLASELTSETLPPYDSPSLESSPDGPPPPSYATVNMEVETPILRPIIQNTHINDSNGAISTSETSVISQSSVCNDTESLHQADSQSSEGSSPDHVPPELRTAFRPTAGLGVTCAMGNDNKGFIHED